MFASILVRHRLLLPALMRGCLHLTLLCGFLTLAAGNKAQSSSDWPFESGTISNTRFAAAEHTITPKNVSKLYEVWQTPLKGSSRATPLVAGDALFVPDANGHIFRIARKDGSIRWSVDLGDALGIPGASAKTLALSGHYLVFGLQTKEIVAAIDANDGSVLWKTEIDADERGRVSQPAIIYSSQVFVGMSGVTEEINASFSGYACCGFRGSIVALDLATGHKNWQTYTVPAGYAGGTLWSRTPSVDPARGTLYVTTGNLYRGPASLQTCVEAHPSSEVERNACFPPDVWFDSILALDLKTGHIRWGFRASSSDIFTGACMAKLPDTFCGGGPDFDFGNGAFLWHAKGRDLVGAGQKSGTFWALDANTGKVVWSRKIGPGGQNGGMQLGSATDGQRIYTAISNAKQLTRPAEEYRLPSGQRIKYGSFAALSPTDGAILWQIPDPAGLEHPGNDLPCDPRTTRENCTGAFPTGPLGIANGVVFACSMSPDGPLYAFDARDGALLWRHTSGASCNNGAAISDGFVYWPLGKTLYAFSID